MQSSSSTPTELPRCITGSGDHTTVDSSSLALCFWTTSALLPSLCWLLLLQHPSCKCASFLPLSLSLLGDQTPLFALRLLDTERVSSFILGLTLDVSIVFFLSQLTSLQEASARLAMGKNPLGARDRNRASVFGPAWPRWVRSHYLSCLHACHHSCPSLLPSSFSDPVTINIKSASCLCPSAISTQRCSQPHVSPQI